MINTVIFDIGYVLVQFDFMTYMENRFEKIVRDAICEKLWGNPYWQDFDLGYRDTEDILRDFARSCPSYEKEMYEAMKHFGDCMYVAEYTKSWIQDLKDKGYRVLFLSNWSEFLANGKPGIMDFTRLMDGGVYSCEVHARKPDRHIYEVLCAKYGLEPESCIFIDDMQKNIDAAIEFGMQAILFEGYEKTSKRLNEALSV